MLFLVCFSFIQGKRGPKPLYCIYFLLKKKKFWTIQFFSIQQDAGCFYLVPGVLLCRKMSNYVIFFKSRGPPGLPFSTVKPITLYNELEIKLCLILKVTTH